MFRFALLALAAASLPAVTVETTLLGTLNGPPPLAAADAQGNVLLATTVPCSVLQECQPISLVKLDPTGRVLFRRSVGDSTWRLQLARVAIDAAGNIVLAGVTADANLPLVRPIRSRPEGQSDVYLVQLSPDGARTLFATYVGGNGNDQLASLTLDGAGNIVASVLTQSSDFPYTAVEGPPPAPNQPFQSVVRIAPATGRLTYAVGFPFVGRPAEPTLTADGAVLFSLLNTGSPGQAPTSRFLILEIAPDGTRRRLPVSMAPEAMLERVLPAADGGYWISGQSVAGGIVPTAGAWRTEPSTFSYLRWETDRSLTPPGPMRQAAVRTLATDGIEGNRVFATTSRGLLRTEDNGWTWELVNDTPALRNPIAFTGGAGRLWAIALSNGFPAIQFSDDAGVTFAEIPAPTRTFGFAFVVAAHASHRQTLYMGIGPTLYLTRNGGETWTQRNLPGNITALTADAENLVVSVITPGGPNQPPRFALHWSSDGGDTFPKTADFAQPPLSLKFDPFTPGRLYLSVSSNAPPRLVRTNWETFPQLETLSSSALPISQFGFQSGMPGAIFGVGIDGRLYRSLDEGVTMAPLPGANLQGILVSQLIVGTGGVVHLATPGASELFLGKITANGDISYLTFVGLRNTSVSLIPLSGGGLALAGQVDGATPFPGELLRGSTSGLPPGFTPPNTGLDIFAIAFDRDATLTYAAALAGVGPDTLFWAGPGPTGSLLLLGVTISPDFPGVPPPGVPLTAGPALFLSRVRP